MPVSIKSSPGNTSTLSFPAPLRSALNHPAMQIWRTLQALLGACTDQIAYQLAPTGVHALDIQKHARLSSSCLWQLPLKKSILTEVLLSVISAAALSRWWGEPSHSHTCAIAAAPSRPAAPRADPGRYPSCAAAQMVPAAATASPTATAPEPAAAAPPAERIKDGGAWTIQRPCPHLWHH